MISLRTIVPVALCVALVACTTDADRTKQAELRGKVVAEKWCSECHRVSVDQPSGARAGHMLPQSVGAPSFMAVADMPNVDHAYLEGLSSEFFNPMPAFRLAPQDHEDVIAYILSLKGQLGDQAPR